MFKFLVAGLALVAAPEPESVDQFQAPFVICDTEQQLVDILEDRSKLYAYYHTKNDKDEPTCIVSIFNMYAHIHEVHLLKTTKEGTNMYAIHVGEDDKSGWLLYVDMIQGEAI